MNLGVIPARYGSTRFPGKALAKVGNKPLIELVWERVRSAKSLHQVVVATDDARIFKAVKKFGGEAVMTPTDLASGTDRVWEAAKETQAQLVVNIQGDEPLVVPSMIDRLVEALEQEPQAQMATLRYPIQGGQDYADPNVVKVVTDQNGWALYFSRSPLPFFRGKAAGRAAKAYKHIGLYAYRRALLEQFVQWGASSLERAEQLEQLRALERGVRIRVLDSPQDTVGVDTPDDLKRVEELLKENLG